MARVIARYNYIYIWASLNTRYIYSYSLGATISAKVKVELEIHGIFYTKIKKLEESVSGLLTVSIGGQWISSAQTMIFLRTTPSEKST